MIVGLFDDDDDGKNFLDVIRSLVGVFFVFLKVVQEGGGVDSEVGFKVDNW